MYIAESGIPTFIAGAPVIGTAGFVGVRIKNKSTSKTLKVIRKAVSEHQGCPINKNVPTKITRKSFKQACKKFKIGSVECSSKNGKYKFKHSKVTGDGFIRIHHKGCSVCPTGEAILKGASYEAPPNIEFVTRFNALR